MKDKRLLIVFSPLYPPHTGGLQNHAFQFNEHIAKEGWNVVVFTPHVVPGSKHFEPQSPNIYVIRFPAFEIIPNYPVPKLWLPLFWKQLGQLKRRSKEYSKRIVISRTRFFLTSIMALVYAKVNGLPWLHIEHGSDFVQLHNRLFSLLARVFDYTFGRLVFLCASSIVANSNASAAFITKLTTSTTATVIYRGVEIETIEGISPALDIKRQFDTKVLITYVGRLIDGKGVTDLLHAFAKLNSKQTHLLIVGDGPQKKALQEMTRNLHIESEVFFYGDTPWSKAISILKVSDIVVNPSYTEGLPTSVLEGALCKKAMVATNVGGTSEIIKHETSGLLVPPRRPDVLNASLERLVADASLRTQFGTSAYASVHTRFSWKSAIRSYIHVLNSLT